MEEQRSFYKGALVGALAVLLAGGIVAGVIIICTWLGFTDDVVDKESELKLEQIQSIIEKNYLYYDDIDDEMVYYITRHWGMQVEVKRPITPPFVFLSYNSNNQANKRKYFFKAISKVCVTSNR